MELHTHSTRAFVFFILQRDEEVVEEEVGVLSASVQQIHLLIMNPAQLLLL